MKKITRHKDGTVSFRMDTEDKLIILEALEDYCEKLRQKGAFPLSEHAPKFRRASRLNREFLHERTA